MCLPHRNVLLVYQNMLPVYHVLLVYHNVLSVSFRPYKPCYILLNVSSTSKCVSDVSKYASRAFGVSKYAFRVAYVPCASGVSQSLGCALQRLSKLLDITECVVHIEMCIWCIEICLSCFWCIKICFPCTMCFWCIIICFPCPSDPINLVICY